MIIVTADVIIPVEEIKYIYKKEEDDKFVLIPKTGGGFYISKESYEKIATLLQENGFTEKIQAEQ